MSIDRADKIVAMLGELNREDYGALPPAERRRLIEALEEAHRIAKVEETVANAKGATAASVPRLTEDSQIAANQSVCGHETRRHLPLWEPCEPRAAGGSGR